MKNLNDYQSQKVTYLHAKLAYHRARLEGAVGEKVVYHESKIKYALSKLAYMGYVEEEAEV